MRIHNRTDGEFGNITCPIVYSHRPPRKHLHKVLTKAGPYCDEDWIPGQGTLCARTRSSRRSRWGRCQYQRRCSISTILVILMDRGFNIDEKRAHNLLRLTTRPYGEEESQREKSRVEGEIYLTHPSAIWGLTNAEAVRNCPSWAHRSQQPIFSNSPTLNLLLFTS